MKEWESTKTYLELNKIQKKTYRYYYRHNTKEYKEYYKLMYYAILNYDDMVKLPLNDLSIYNKLYEQIILDNPLFFYVDSIIFSFYSQGVIANFKYSMNWKKCYNIFSQIFKTICKLQNECKNLDEIQKEEHVHKYIISNVKYELNESLPIHLSYSLFIYGRAVCDGISKASKILLDNVGVKSLVITGNSFHPSVSPGTFILHTWNVVWIKGIPYHVDFTFDCNLSERQNIIRYDYFNLSDNQIKQDHSFKDIGVNASVENDWFRMNNQYFSKKQVLKTYINQQMKREAAYISFKMPYTTNRKKTIDSIIKLVEKEIQLNISRTISYRFGINEEQMVIYIYFL